MSFAPISNLVHKESLVLKYDFLFSVNVPDVYVKQRSVSESTYPDFEYPNTNLITIAIILQERPVFVGLDGAMRKCSRA